MLEDKYKEPFVELHRILDCLKQKDLGPALKWAEENKEALNLQGSALEFKLHRLAFINLLKKGTKYQKESIDYARTNFPKFIKTHEKGFYHILFSQCTSLLSSFS